MKRLNHDLNKANSTLKKAQAHANELQQMNASLMERNRDLLQAGSSENATQLAMPTGHSAFNTIIEEDDDDGEECQSDKSFDHSSKAVEFAQNAKAFVKDSAAIKAKKGKPVLTRNLSRDSLVKNQHRSAIEIQRMVRPGWPACLWGT